MLKRILRGPHARVNHNLSGFGASQVKSPAEFLLSGTSKARGAHLGCDRAFIRLVVELVVTVVYAGADIELHIAHEANSMPDNFASARSRYTAHWTPTPCLCMSRSQLPVAI